MVYTWLQQPPNPNQRHGRSRVCRRRAEFRVRALFAVESKEAAEHIRHSAILLAARH
jgi:hypothetical protein